MKNLILKASYALAIIVTIVSLCSIENANSESLGKLIVIALIGTAYISLFSYANNWFEK